MKHLRLMYWTILAFLRLTVCEERIVKCKDNTEADFFITNEPFDLCCTDTSGDCHNLTLCSSKTKTCQNAVVSSQNSCAVQYHKNNATKADEDVYTCYNGGLKKYVKDVFILEKLERPSIKQITCSEKSRRVVVFYHKRSKDVTYNYTVVLKKRSFIVTLCGSETVTSVTCDDIRNECICDYNLSEVDTEAPNANVSIVVTVEQPPGQHAETQEYFNCMDHKDHSHKTHSSFQSEKLDGLTVENITSSTTLVKITPSFELFRVITFRYVQFNFIISSIEGIPEERKVCINVSKVTIDCLIIPLTNLTSYTKYMVTGSASSLGGEGEKTSVEFTTLESAPLHPPQIDDYAFSKGTDSDGQFSLAIVWQPLSHAVQGGSNLTYSVEVTTQDGIQIANVTNTNQTYALLKPQKQPSEPLFVKIWAENNAGKSGSRSFIISSLVSKKPDALMKVVDKKMNVYVDLSTITEDSVLVLNWCKGYLQSEEFYVCEEYPKYVQLCSRVTEGKCLQSYSKTSKRDAGDGFTHTKEMEYFEKNSYSVVVKKANATVTTQQDEEQQVYRVQQSIMDSVYTRFTVLDVAQPDDLPAESVLLSQQTNGIWSGMTSARAYTAREAIVKNSSENIAALATGITVGGIFLLGVSVFIWRYCLRRKKHIMNLRHDSFKLKDAEVMKSTAELMSSNIIPPPSSQKNTEAEQSASFSFGANTEAEQSPSFSFGANYVMARYVQNGSQDSKFSETSTESQLTEDVESYMPVTSLAESDEVTDCSFQESEECLHPSWVHNYPKPAGFRCTGTEDT